MSHDASMRVSHRSSWQKNEFCSLSSSVRRFHHFSIPTIILVPYRTVPYSWSYDRYQTRVGANAESYLEYAPILSATTKLKKIRILSMIKAKFREIDSFVKIFLKFREGAWFIRIEYFCASVIFHISSFIFFPNEDAHRMLYKEPHANSCQNPKQVSRKAPSSFFFFTCTTETHSATLSTLSDHCMSWLNNYDSQPSGGTGIIINK